MRTTICLGRTVKSVLSWLNSLAPFICFFLIKVILTLNVIAPTNTPSNSVAIDPYWNHLHKIESPKTPNYVAEVSLPEQEIIQGLILQFQGGSFDSWGGLGPDSCASFTGAEFESVFYKNAYSFGLKGINYYMVSSRHVAIPKPCFEALSSKFAARDIDNRRFTEEQTGAI